MAQIGTQHQLRRDTTGNLAGYTGPVGEFLFDTTLNRVVLQDGSVQGGYPTAMADTQPITTSTTILVTTALAIISSTVAGIVVTLPPVASYPPGQFLSVGDMFANSTVANVTITTSSTTESIQSSTGGVSTSWTLNGAGQVFRALSNSSAKWVGASNYG